MTDLQREWEDILESYGLPADRGDTVLDQAIYLGNPRAFADEKSEYSTFVDSVEAEQPRWLEPSGWTVPVRVVTPEELAAFDPGGCALTYFVDLRTKHRRDKWKPELQAARFRGRHHSAETRRRIGEANRKTYWAKTPEERAKSLANRMYKKCEPGCTCGKHDPEVSAKRRKKLRGKKHKVSPEGRWRQDMARRPTLWSDNVLADRRPPRKKDFRLSGCRPCEESSSAFRGVRSPLDFGPASKLMRYKMMHKHSVELAGRNHVCAFFNTIDEQHRVLGLHSTKMAPAKEKSQLTLWIPRTARAKA